MSIENFDYINSSALPQSYSRNMTTYEELVFFVAKLKECIVAFNALETKEGQFETSTTNTVNHYIELYNELKGYVDNYFDNLDVQVEINNKLNALVADGTMELIINQEIFGDFNNTLINHTNKLITNDIDIISIKSSLQDTAINVKYFGAIGNGIADDTIAIQTALDTGKSVRLPRGTYLVTDSLKFSTNSMLIGDYESGDDYAQSTTKILFKPTLLKDLFIHKVQPESTVYVEGIYIQGITVQGGNANCNYVINMKNLYKPVFDNLNAYGGFKCGILIDGWLGAYSNRCSFMSISDHHIKVIRTGYVTTTTTFNKCYFSWGNIGLITEDNSANALNFNDCIFETLNWVCDVYNGNIITLNNPHIENVPKTDTLGLYMFNIGVNGNKTFAKLGSFVINGGNIIGAIPTFTNTKILNADYIRNISINNCNISRAHSLFDITANVENLSFNNVTVGSVTYISNTTNWDNVCISGCNFDHMIKNTSEVSQYIKGIAMLPQIYWLEKLVANITNGNMYLDAIDMQLKYKDKFANVRKISKLSGATSLSTFNGSRLQAGEIVENSTIGLGQPVGWVNQAFSGDAVYNSGANCDTVIGSPIIHNVNPFYGLVVGDRVTVSLGMASTTIQYRIIARDSVAQTITLDTNATSTTTGATVYMPKHNLQPFGQQGNRDCVGTPVSVVVPYFIGEEILDTTNKIWYKSVGLTNADWK